MILQYFDNNTILIESKEGIKYLLFPTREILNKLDSEELKIEGELKIVKERKIVVDDLSIVYIEDEGQCFVDSSFNKADIAIIPVSKGLEFLYEALDYQPKVVLLRDYKVEKDKRIGIKSLNELLPELSSKGLLKFVTNPCVVKLPMYAPEIWIFCVEGDSLDFILKGNRDYSI